jgi:hypothetical protein
VFIRYWSKRIMAYLAAAIIFVTLWALGCSMASGGALDLSKHEAGR